MDDASLDCRGEPPTCSCTALRVPVLHCEAGCCKLARLRPASHCLGLGRPYPTQDALYQDPRKCAGKHLSIEPDAIPQALSLPK